MTADKKTTFVLVIPAFEDFFHSYYAGEIIKGVSLAASRLKLDILIHIPERFDHRQWLQSPFLTQGRVHGIIFGDIDGDFGVVRRALQRGFPVMVLNNQLEAPVNCIAIDNFNGAVQAVNHLIELGHQRIATICGDLTTQAGVLRLEGYKKAMAAAKLKPRRHWIQEGHFLRGAARTAAKRLLDSKNRPTAVFAASDVMALEVIDVARQRGLTVPRDLSVVGFDNNPLAQNGSVPLTTVDQPLMEMGRLGAEHLRLVTQGRVPLPIKILLPTKLIVRASTAKPAQV